jgi:AraC-like DNA-binding protein/ligand-binding sensor protein
MCSARGFKGAGLEEVAGELMRSAPGSYLLPESERPLFIEQFEKDIPFLKLFFHWISRSSPVRNVDLVWVEHEPSGQSCLRHLGIAETLEDPASRLLGCHRQKAYQAFCNVINGNGLHQSEACGLSGTAARELVRQTGKSQVYRCHFGLIDVAVPVMMHGQHVATLVTGHALGVEPSEEGFLQVAREAAPLSTLELQQLEQAYWSVRVVSDTDIRNITELLESFAGYLSNSWLRLAEAVKERRRKDRKLQLSRKEFAYLALESSDPGGADFDEIRELGRKIGFTKTPNRVLVVRLETQQSFATVLAAVEEFCEGLTNVSAAHLRKTGICVFFYDPQGRQGRSAGVLAHRLARRVLHAIEEQCGLRVRIGMGTAKDEWRHLADSYREASTALAGSTATIATYRRPTNSFAGLSGYAERLNQLLTQQNLDEAQSAIASLPVLVSRCLNSGTGDFTAVSLFFSATLESLCFTARNLGCDADAIAHIGNSPVASLGSAADLFQLREIWLHSAARIVKEIQRLYSSKRNKIAERACRMIEDSIECGLAPERISLSHISTSLGVSASHMSRTFKLETGRTFEQYLAEKRVEHARRLLLDPLNNVSEVARKCGFTDASYFARVFRRVAGCSPSEYCQAPIRASAPAPQVNA